MANRFVLNETSYHGKGAIQSIVSELQARGLANPMVCSDPDLVKYGVTQKVTQLLEEAGVKYNLNTNIKPNPTIENVQYGVSEYKKNSNDCIIAVGGGSSIDTAKGIAIIITNPEFEDVRSLEGVAPTKNACAPIIAVNPLGIVDIISGSTTATTGISCTSTHTIFLFFSSSVIT